MRRPAVHIFIAAGPKQPKRERQKRTTYVRQAEATQHAGNLGGGHRFVRIATQPIMHVVIEVHAPLAAISLYVGGKVAAPQQAMEPKQRRIYATRPALSGRG